MINVAVDASRVKSGGGIAHLLGILSEAEVKQYGIQQVHVWAYQALLDVLPARSWLVKHQPVSADQSLARQLYWQAVELTKEIQSAQCDILFAADASTLCRFKPMVVLNQNMLPYEKGMVALFGLSRERLRQHFIFEVQKRAFKAADGNIFLTQHAATCVQRHTGPIANTICIPHGVNQVFLKTPHHAQWPMTAERPIRCLYVSPIYEYKYQWVVVRAIKMLRERGYHVTLSLVGGGGARAKKMLAQQIKISDPLGEFVTVEEFLPHSQIPERIAQSDLFIFASGCETFGISLLEAMAVGVPIASSHKSSLPETLQDAGEYFDPESDQSIAAAVERLIVDPSLRQRLSQRAKELAVQYSWARCAASTWQFITEIERKTKAKGLR